MNFSQWLTMNYEGILIDEKKNIIKMLRYNGASKELAEDIYQDLFIKVKITLETGKYFEEGKYKNWLQFIAKNMFIDIQRKKYKSKVQPTVYIINGSGEEVNVSDFKKDEALNPEEATIALEKEFDEDYAQDILISKVIDAQEKLPVQLQEIFNLRIRKGMKFIDISKMLKVKNNTVLGRMRYLRMNIKQMVNGN